MSSNFVEVGTDVGDLDDTQDPCLAGGIGGFIVEESVEILEVCQDPDQIGVIFLRVSVQGVFTYVSNLTVSYLSSNGSLNTVNADSKAIYNYKNSPEAVQGQEFSTLCGSRTVLMAYDIGTLIDEFSSLASIDFDLRLDGTFISDEFDHDFTGLPLFTSSNPSDQITFTKGLNPQPYALYFDEITGTLKLQFSSIGDIACSCNINCVDITLEGEELFPCDDELQEVEIETGDIFSSPTDVFIDLSDSNGNSTNLAYHIVLGTTPVAPGVVNRSSPTRIEVVPHLITVDGDLYDKDKIQYELWRYENTQANAKVLKRWTGSNFKNLTDTSVKPGNSYGYSIRVKGDFDSISNFSTWSTEISLPSSEHLNLIMWMIDDIGPSQLSFYDDQNSWPEDFVYPATPFLESIKQTSGLRFLNAGVNARCSPTRASMLSGRLGHITQQHPYGTGVGDVAGNIWPPFTGVNGVTGKFQGIRENHNPWPQVAKAAGSPHSFMIAGKYHNYLRTGENTVNIIDHREPIEIAGFDHSIEPFLSALSGQGGEPNYGYANYEWFLKYNDTY